MESVAGKAQFQTSHILSDCKVAVTRRQTSVLQDNLTIVLLLNEAYVKSGKNYLLIAI